MVYMPQLVFMLYFPHSSVIMEPFNWAKWKDVQLPFACQQVATTKPSDNEGLV